MDLHHVDDRPRHLRLRGGGIRAQNDGERKRKKEDERPAHPDDSTEEALNRRTPAVHAGSEVEGLDGWGQLGHDGGL